MPLGYWRSALHSQLIVLFGEPPHAVTCLCIDTHFTLQWPRLIKQAVEAKKPVLILSVGPSRADGMPGVDKIEMKAGPVLKDVVELYLK